jgi:branched-subunit amino acid aminotransferase/4-amino-4-deoxychorismate lyase
MSATRFRWNGSELADVSGAPVLPLYVGDSFLLDEGKVVGYQRHLDRFSRSANAQGLVRPVDDFLAAVTAWLPRTGTWFPRIDLTERGELELHIRPAPPLTSTIVLGTASRDPRTEPLIKGPDIPALELLRNEAKAFGADEAIILDHQGRIIDGATTCLVWFREQTLFTPPAEARRLDSTTVATVADIARAHGFAIETEWATPADLAGVSLWALNALHGIRAVTAWIDGPELAQDASMLGSWRADYAQLALTIDDAS